MEDTLANLRRRLEEVNDLEAAAAVLSWDRYTQMPPGGQLARDRQLALLRRLAHERFTDASVGRQLDALDNFERELPYDSPEASLIRVARREYQREVRIPPSFVEELASHSSAGYRLWLAAREANNFEVVRASLEETINLSIRYAAYCPEAKHPADPLIERRDPGMDVEVVSRLFSQLRSELIPMVRQLAVKPPAQDRCVRQHFPEAKQLEFGYNLIRLIGYDTDRGRQDKAPHPFMTRFSRGDVRITTRVKEDDLREALFSTLHEAGHALYEQGVDPELEGTLLARGASAGLHESQARLWENLIGRSRTFWEGQYPGLCDTFPTQLGQVSLDTFYSAINHVVRSAIRADADEVTYNLHIILRFDFELALLEGRLAVRDLPAAWAARFDQDFGITPQDQREGVLQDPHWYDGLVGGMFQGYTLGNILSAQLLDGAVRDCPTIPTEISAGRFGPLRRWLTDRLYRHGRKFTPSELTEMATGRPLDVGPYLQYLRAKYGHFRG